VNPFLRAPIFVATSHKTQYVTAGGQQEGYSWNKARIR